MPDAAADGLASQVGRVLRWIWDPIDLGKLGPADEYDGYVLEFTALTRDPTVFEDVLIAHFARIEVEMCLSLPPAKRTRSARALLGLRNAYMQGYGRLVEQWTSPDGLHCLWVIETRDGLYTYEQGVLRHEDDENGRCSWWADAGLGRSGLFDTAKAAAQEARSLAGWWYDDDHAIFEPQS